MELLREVYFINKEDLYEALDKRLPMEICELVLKYKRKQELPMLALSIASTAVIVLATMKTI